ADHGGRSGLEPESLAVELYRPVVVLQLPRSPIPVNAIQRPGGVAAATDRADVLRKFLGVFNEVRIVDQGYPVFPFLTGVPPVAVELFERSQLRVKFILTGRGRRLVKLFPQLFNPLNDFAGVDHIILLAELAHGGGSLCVCAWWLIGRVGVVPRDGSRSPWHPA